MVAEIAGVGDVYKDYLSTSATLNQVSSAIYNTKSEWITVSVEVEKKLNI